MRRLSILLLTASAAFAQLEGVVDLHVHCAPDDRPRSVDALEIARIAERYGMRALLFKRHNIPTASLAYLVHQEVPGILVYGGIALNASVGGINPVAVETMARTTGGLGRVVWMPTYDSEHYTRTYQPNPHFVPVSRDGGLLPTVLEVLDVMAKEGLSLATGHSSPEESLLLVREARKRGIERIIVTHPFDPLVGMTVGQAREAAREGAYLEFSYNQVLPGAPTTLDDYARAIRAVGVERSILTSDLGQPENPIHTSGLVTFFEQLRQRGFTEAEIRRMSRENPARFLGLP